MICENNSQYWLNTLIKSYSLIKSETFVFKTLVDSDNITLFIAGKNYDDTKKGFLKIIILT